MLVACQANRNVTCGGSEEWCCVEEWLGKASSMAIKQADDREGRKGPPRALTQLNGRWYEWRREETRR